MGRRRGRGVRRVARLAGLLAAGATFAQDEPIATDRPDFVESSLVVGTGTLQVETSLAYEREEEGGLGARLWTTPTLLRYGVAPGWELRLETAGLARSRVEAAGLGSATDEGVADISLGLKWHAADEAPARRRPSAAWLFHVDLETGSSAFAGEDARPSVRWVGEWTLPRGFGLGVMPGVRYDKRDGERFLAGLLGIVVGRSLGALTRVFGEVSFRQIAGDAHGGNAVSLDAGFSRLLGSDAQVDLALVLGMTDEAADVGATLGYSIRL